MQEIRTRRRRRNLLVALAVILATACTDDEPEPERTADSFCGAWEALAAELDVQPETFQPAEFASPGQLRDLASHAPDDELADALERLALVQPDAIAQLNGLNDGSVGPEQYDQELFDEYAIAGKAVLLGWWGLCRT